MVWKELLTHILVPLEFLFSEHIKNFPTSCGNVGLPSLWLSAYLGIAHVRDRFDCKWKIQENRHKLRRQDIHNTGFCTRRLGFAPDYWALPSTTGLFIRQLDFALDYWALHPTTGPCTQLLGFAPDY